MQRENPEVTDRRPRPLTKIVATVGPASRDAPRLRELVDAGVDVFRFNMAHGSRDAQARTIAEVRRIGEELDRPLGVLVDLAGPKIRLGSLAEDPTTCVEGAEFRIVRGEQARAADELVANYETLVDELTVGDRVMLADGTVSMEVIDAGVIRSRQGINLPGVRLSVSSMPEKEQL